MNGPKQSLPTNTAKRRAWGRVLLGNAQMFFAVATVVIVVMTGVTVYSITLVIVTTALTVTSVVLYGDFLGLRRKS